MKIQTVSFIAFSDLGLTEKQSDEVLAAIDDFVTWGQSEKHVLFDLCGFAQNNKSLSADARQALTGKIPANYLIDVAG